MGVFATRDVFLRARVTPDRVLACAARICLALRLGRAVQVSAVPTHRKASTTVDETA